MQFRLRDQRGFTLTELVISLAVIGVLASAFIATRAIILSSQISNAVAVVGTLRDAANQYLMTQVNRRYSGISMTVLDSQRLVPSTMINTDANPWGGSYAISEINGGNDFRVVLTSVPDAAGPRINSSLTNHAPGSYDAGTKVLTLDFTR